MTNKNRELEFLEIFYFYSRLRVENYLKVSIERMLKQKKWDPDNYPWKQYSWELLYHVPNYIDIWWDSEKFNWNSTIGVCDELCKSCNKQFDIWWDPEKFNWKDYSNYLCDYCSEHFETWWDPKKFNWNDSSYNLVTKCMKYFDKWWDPKKFNWSAIHLFDKFPKNFDLAKNVPYSNKQQYTKFIKNYPYSIKDYWKPDRFDWKLSEILPDHKPDDFDIWWNPKLFQFNHNSIKKLIERCHKHLPKWWNTEKVLQSIDKTMIYKFFLYCYDTMDIWGEHVKKYITFSVRKSDIALTLLKNQNIDYLIDIMDDMKGVTIELEDVINFITSDTLNTLKITTFLK